MNILLHGINILPEFHTYIEQLIQIFNRKSVQLYLTPGFSNSVKKSRLNGNGLGILKDKAELKNIDFVISIGGDGTLLDTISFIGPYETPVIGINTGRMGFLATIAKEEIELAANDLIEGKYSLEDRSLVCLEANVPLFDGLNFGLNEFTIHKSGHFFHDHCTYLYRQGIPQQLLGRWTDRLYAHGFHRILPELWRPA
jgi:NAD+ kinase